MRRWCLKELSDTSEAIINKSKKCFQYVARMSKDESKERIALGSPSINRTQIAELTRETDDAEMYQAWFSAVLARCPMMKWKNTVELRLRQRQKGNFPKLHPEATPSKSLRLMHLGYLWIPFDVGMLRLSINPVAEASKGTPESKGRKSQFHGNDLQGERRKLINIAKHHSAVDCQEIIARKRRSRVVDIKESSSRRAAAIPRPLWRCEEKPGNNFHAIHRRLQFKCLLGIGVYLQL